MPAPWRWWRCPWRARGRCRSCCWAARQVHWGSAEAEAAEGPAAVLAEGPAEEPAEGPAEGPAAAAAEPAQGPAEGPAAAAAAEWLAEDWGFAEGSP